MKTIFLMRHAEPKRLPDVSQEEWPLSDLGRESAKCCFGQRFWKTAVHVYASPFLRALQTAQHSDLPMTVDYRLAERRTGIYVPEFGDCWLRQYEDGAIKYGERNWEKGIDLHSYIDSAVRHFLKYLDGWDDEPHDRAFIWNILGAIWTLNHHLELVDIPFELLGNQRQIDQTVTTGGDIIKNLFDAVSPSHAESHN